MLTLLSVVIGIVYPNVVSAFGFIGGTAGVCVVILFPFWIYVHDSKQEWYQGYSLIVTILNILLSTSGFIAAIVSLLVAFKVMDCDNLKCSLYGGL